MTQAQLNYYRNLIKNPSDKYLREAAKACLESSLERLGGDIPMSQAQKNTRYRTKITKKS